VSLEKLAILLADTSIVVSSVTLEYMVKWRNINVQHLVLFLRFLGPVFIQQEAASTSVVTSYLASTHTTC
jgi:hypothetical protein